MLRFRFAVALLALVTLGASPGARADAPPIGLVLLDFSYLDTSGEAADQTAAHQKRLQAFMAALRQDFGADRQFRLVTPSCTPAPCTVDEQVPAELLQAAAAAGGKILVIGGVHKLSTLVQFAKVHAIDVDGNRVVLDKLFTFRGDTDEAWNRAEAFVSEEIRAALVPPP